MGLRKGEKRGIVFYYDYRRQLRFVSPALRWSILAVLSELDERGGISETTEEMQQIQADPTASALFEVFPSQQKRASTAWHNINKSQHSEKYDSDGHYETDADFDESKRLPPKTQKDNEKTATAGGSNLKKGEKMDTISMSEEVANMESGKYVITSNGKYSTAGYSIAMIYTIDPEWLREFAQGDYTGDKVAQKDKKFVLAFLKDLYKDDEDDNEEEEGTVRRSVYIAKSEHDDDEGVLTITTEDGDSFDLCPTDDELAQIISAQRNRKPVVFDFCNSIACFDRVDNDDLPF